ncbi:MAG: energy-coupling factor transporter ATPase [Clostridiales bacterium]|nr:energy-coupling factor transporter ATPase [Clostridiales bacterium]
MIEVKNLSFVYSPKTPFTTQALFDINLKIETGDFFGIIGSTGAGKSTLVSHFNALTKVQKNSGAVLVDDMDLSAKKVDLKKLRSKVGMVFQYPEHQLFADTVLKDVMFGPKNLGLDKAECETRAKNAIELVGLNFAEIAERSPFELSGGQKRRVAIAGVIAMQPEILILDEPTAGLDPKGKREIMELVLRIKQSCPTVVMISHNMDEISEYCNKIAVLKNGRVMGVFSPRELFGSEELLNNCGVELPLVTELAVKLNALGVSVDKSVLTEAELFEQIKKAGNYA